MSAAVLIQLVLTILEAVISGLTSSKAAPELIDAAQKALAAVLAVQQTDVTYGQLEAARAKPQW